MMAAAVAPLLAADGVMISLQNGLGNAESLAAAAGADRVLAGRVIFGVERIAAGHVRGTGYADPVLLGACEVGAPPLRARAPAPAERLAAAGIPALPCDDIVAALWGKVLYNAALNPLGALLGVHYGALGEDPDIRAIMDAVVVEAVAVAAAEGVRLPWGTAEEYMKI